MTNDLVQAFWEEYRLASSTDPADVARADEYFWAYETVDDAAQEGDEGVVGLLVSLAETAPDDLALAYLGAGPIENLVRQHGPRLADLIEAAARRHARFATALDAVVYGPENEQRVLRKRLRRLND